MKLKTVIHNNDFCLATESGDIIENAEIKGHLLPAGGLITVTFIVTAVYGEPGKIIDADEIAVQALPAPRPTLPSRTCIELSPEQVQDNFERLQRQPFLCDHDPDDYAPIVRDDDEDGEEWDEES